MTVFYDAENMCLLCPVCGASYTHLTRTTHYTEKDGRRCVKLWFYCECGHEFSVDFWQHEGQTFLKIENGENDDTKNI